MKFILLVFFAAFILEIIGSIISVIGLTSIFGTSYLIIAMAVAFDFAKIVSVSFLYQEWASLKIILKTYLSIASFILILITSAGALGFLSASFQASILPVITANSKIELIEKEKTKLENRKIQIDNQISNLPADMVKGRTKLLGNFKTELEHVNSRINELDQQIPALKIETIEKTAHAGPITYIAQLFNTSTEKAMSIFIYLVLGVFDPLAIALILSGNYLIAKRNKKVVKDETADLFEKIDNSSEYTIKKAWEAFGNLKPTAPVDWTLQPEYEREYSEEPEENPLVDDEVEELYRDITSIPYIDDHAEESNMYPYFTPDFEEELAQSSLTDIHIGNTDVNFVDATRSKSDHFYK